MSPATLVVLSALGGALGAIAIRPIVKWLAKQWLERRPIMEYICDGKSGSPPALLYGGGRPDESAGCLRYGKTDKCAEQHLIFGPRANDFGRPGYYKIRFLIRGKGFSARKDSTCALLLDVMHAPWGTDEVYVLHKQERVMARDLEDKAKPVDVIIYTIGSGAYEYRCEVFNDVFTKDPPEEELEFTKIQVFRYFPGWEVL